MSSGSPCWAMPQLFGEKLRTLRRQRGLTQVDLARALGLATHSHVSYLESGKSAPSLDLVIRAADLLGVTTDYLLRYAIPISHPLTSTARSSADQLASRFGSKLRELRTRQDMTQVELSAQLHVTAQYISFLESGRKIPSIDFVLLCADLFGVTTDELLREAANPLSSDGRKGK